jgi:hypothetical protein
VSSHDQKNDLDAQAGRVAAWAATNDYAVTRVITEIGSGLNPPRKELMPLLRQAIAAVITLCQELQLPLAHEKLDFGNKKLANNGKKPNELLYMMPPRYSPR